MDDSENARLAYLTKEDLEKHFNSDQLLVLKAPIDMDIGFRKHKPSVSLLIIFSSNISNFIE